MLSVRPKVAELAYVLYGRPLHPELFEVHASRIVSRGDYQVKIDITNTGHVVTWQYEGLTWTEVSTAVNHPLPVRRRLMLHQLKAKHHDEFVGRGGVSYSIDIQLENVQPEIFWMFQHELSREGPGQGLFFQFNPSGRMPLGAISFIAHQARNKSLCIQAFHTFPDDCALAERHPAPLRPHRLALPSKSPASPCQPDGGATE